MIHVLFVPGMFGSTIEYIVRAYSNEFEPLRSDIGTNGSMHSFNKMNHWWTLDQIYSAYNSDPKPTGISSTTYPQEDHHLPDILNVVSPLFDLSDKKILVYAKDIRSAEIGMLFQYYKISIGESAGLSIFFGKIDSLWTQWNPTYTSWQDMKPWEVREWLSIFYPSWIQEWIDAKHQADETYLKISNIELLENTKEKFLEIFEHCNLTQRPGLSEFATIWQNAQQYILDEYSTILEIVESTVTGKAFSWQPISIIAEAIVQQHLRSKGYEIKCDGLNTFPADSQTLFNLLERC